MLYKRKLPIINFEMTFMANEKNQLMECLQGNKKKSIKFTKSLV